MGNVVPIDRETPYVLAVKELIRAVRAINSDHAVIWLDRTQSVVFWRDYLVVTKQDMKVKLSRAGFWRSVRGIYHLDGVTFEWDWEEMLNALAGMR